MRFMDRLRADPLYFSLLAGSVLAAAIALLLFGPGRLAAGAGLDGVAPGQVAFRDITAGKEVSYIDAEATRARILAEERLVLPVFTLDPAIGARNHSRMREYRDYVLDLVSRKTAEETLYLMTEARFPGVLGRAELAAIVRSPLRAQAFAYADSLLESLMYEGVFLLPSEGLEPYNQDYFEVRRLKQGGAASEERSRSRMLTADDLPRSIMRDLTERHLARPLADYTALLVRAFAAENGFAAPGSLKLIAAAADGRVLGIHAVGSYASEMIWGGAVAIEQELSVADLREVVFPHPSVCETIREAAWAMHAH
jgi:hypothetical protein